MDHFGLVRFDHFGQGRANLKLSHNADLQLLDISIDE